MVNVKRIFVFAILIGIAPSMVAFLQGLTISLFFEAYGFYKSPANAAMNVRYVRWIILAIIGFIFYLWYLNGAVKKTMIDVLFLFVAALCTSALIDVAFGDFSFSQIISMYSLGHLIIALLSFVIYWGVTSLQGLKEGRPGFV